MSDANTEARGATLLRLPAAAWAEIQTHAERGYPHEVCGLLVGRFAEGMRVREVVSAHPARNLNQERAADRYDLDPGDYARIETQASKAALEVVGVYHSHPDHPSKASETDRQRAADIWGDTQSWSYLIVEVAQGQVASRRCWVLDRQAFHEEPIELT